MLSSTVKGEAVETYEMYTLHAEISDNGNVRIYADDFNRWVPSDPCPEETVQLSADTIQQIKDIIDEIDLYHMRRNIGSRDRDNRTVKRDHQGGDPGESPAGTGTPVQENISGDSD